MILSFNNVVNEYIYDNEIEFIFDEKKTMNNKMKKDNNNLINLKKLIK